MNNKQGFFPELFCLVGFIGVSLLAATAARVAPDSAYPPAGITGEADPVVTQKTIHQTICVPDYTAKVRAVTETEKAAVLKRDGQTKPGCCEVDHLISLEIGGTNNPDKNLWSEPYAGKYGARIKDQVENKLHRMVCASSDSMPLEVAQKCILSDWVRCGRQIGVIQ